jgi:hypothetical protein
MIKHKNYTIELGKQIDVFDGVFPLRFREHAYEMFYTSLFKIGWSDTLDPERKKYDHHIHSQYNEADINRLGIFQHMDRYPEISGLLTDLEFTKAIVNLSNMSDVNYNHCHNEKKVVLYYGNIHWPDGAHGETNFYSEDLTEIQFTSPFVPGRLIIFDGNIPHCIRPQSPVGPKYRFTFAMTFDKIKEGTT